MHIYAYTYIHRCVGRYSYRDTRVHAYESVSAWGEAQAVASKAASKATPATVAVSITWESLKMRARVLSWCEGIR